MEKILSTLGLKRAAPPPRFIPVTVDKSHLITIGERLYTESIELIRELVNNAFSENPGAPRDDAEL